jgi:hypothetical protein
MRLPAGSFVIESKIRTGESSHSISPHVVPEGYVCTKMMLLHSNHPYVLVITDTGTILLTDVNWISWL